MAKKFKLAQNPTFKSEVQIPLVGGETASVVFEFKMLPRKELAKIYDSWVEQAKAAGAAIEEDKATLTILTDFEIEMQVNQLKDILVGWNIEDEFNDENIERFVGVSVNAPKAVIEAFQEAYSSAKVGN